MLYIHSALEISLQKMWREGSVAGEYGWVLYCMGGSSSSSRSHQHICPHGKTFQRKRNVVRIGPGKKRYNSSYLHFYLGRFWSYCSRLSRNTITPIPPRYHEWLTGCSEWWIPEYKVLFMRNFASIQYWIPGYT